MKLVDVLSYEEKYNELKKWDEEIVSQRGLCLYTKEASEYLNDLSRDKLLLFARYAPYINKLFTAEREENLKSYEELSKAKKDREQYVSHLESEVSRLKKAVHEIYTDIKLKGMKFITNAKPDKNVSDIFLNVFENYLK